MHCMKRQHSCSGQSGSQHSAPQIWVHSAAGYSPARDYWDRSYHYRPSRLKTAFQQCACGNMLTDPFQPLPSGKHINMLFQPEAIEMILQCAMASHAGLNSCTRRLSYTGARCEITVTEARGDAALAFDHIYDHTMHIDTWTATCKL